MHSSEGMFYTNEIQKQNIQIILLKIKKIFVWGKLDKNILLKKDLKIR